MRCTQLMLICGSIFYAAGEICKSLPSGRTPCLYWIGLSLIGLALAYSIVAPIIKHEMKKSLPKPGEDIHS